MLEFIVLGIIQGATEWLPISSEGMITLVKVHFFHATSLQSIIQQALFLHLGTFLAALIYLRKDVLVLCQALFRFQQASEETKKVFFFLFWATILSGALGAGILLFILKTMPFVESSGKIITLLVGLLLFITATVQHYSKDQGTREAKSLGLGDTFVLGIAQGLSALPGISRSGTTIACFLLRRFDKTIALRLSFLMSLPIVLAGNIVLGAAKGLVFSWEALAGVVAAFVVGFLTLRGFFRVAETMNFSRFLFFLGSLTILSVFL